MLRCVLASKIVSPCFFFFQHSTKIDACLKQMELNPPTEGKVLVA